MEARMIEPVQAGAILRGVERLVVVCPSWVGDCVMATPTLRALRHALPDARITLLARPGLDALLTGAPWFDEIIVATNHGLLDPVRLAARIRDLHADAALLLPNSFRSACTIWLSRVPKRIGYDRDGRGWLLTHRMRSPDPRRPMPAVDYYAALTAWALGSRAIERRMELFVTDEQRQAGDVLLTGVDRPFALLNPGANRADKRWPIERFAEVAAELSRRHDLAIVASGAPAEAALLDELVALSPVRVLNLASRGVTLGSLKSAIQRSAILITNDTGPRHLAVALDRPVVTLFGPTDHRWTTVNHPRERIVLAQPFLPEEQVADARPRECGIDRIAVKDVLHAAADLLADRPSQHSLE
jgi:heptosyltransferase-2